MKQYDSYKDSGVEWIGEVPNHWEIMPLKFTGTFGNGLTYSPKDVVDNGILVLRSSNIQNSSLSFEDNVYVSNVSKVLLVQKGDVIICSRNGSAALVGKSAFIDKDINATFGAFMMRYIPKINKKYGFYLFQTAIGRYKGYFATTTINQLTKSTIGEMKVPLANTEEQNAMVTYLDKKCSEIDKVISAQQKRITLLQELKQSVITHAVTKGLNPNVEMKDSGVEWIGEVPTCWNVMPIKRVAKTNSGSTPKNIKGKSNDESVIKWVRTTDLSDMADYVYDSSEYLSKTEFCSASCPWLPKHTVVVAMYGGAGTIGKTGILGIDATINQALCSLETKSIEHYKYLFYTIKALRPYWMKLAASSRKDPNISQDIIRNMKVVVPSYIEQEDIVDYLDRKCSSLDNSISKAQHQVDLLQEYKQSLITEVVTGKRKVC